jgi:hypothetical protein
MAAVERIPKNGRNEFHKYDYATEADIVAAIRGELASRGVMLIPSIVDEQRHPVGEKGSVLTVLSMQMEFRDADSNESIVKPWRGYGTDKEDKGGYKAMTGGEKYYMLKTFLIPTGDDPESDDTTHPQARANQRAAAERRPIPQAPVQRASQASAPPQPPQQIRYISDPQRKRLYAIASHAGWKDAEVKDYLKRKHGIETSAAIPMSKYEEICTALEAGAETGATNGQRQ